MKICLWFLRYTKAVILLNINLLIRNNSKIQAEATFLKSNPGNLSESTGQSIIDFFAEITNPQLLSLVISMFVKIFINNQGAISFPINYNNLKIWPSSKSVNQEIDSDTILRTTLTLVNYLFKVNPNKISLLKLKAELYFRTFIYF